MSTFRSRDVERLHHVLLRELANQRDTPLTTAELRQRAQEALTVISLGPVVIEAVYRALRTLHRRGQVAHHRPDGRHAQWTLTPVAWRRPRARWTSEPIR